MARKRKYMPVVRARRLLLVVLALVVVGVGAIWFFGRTEPEPGAVAGDAEDRTRREGLVLAGEGFDYELSDGERQVFRIQADRIVSDRRNNISLESVKIAVAREDGSFYRVFGDSADYRLGTSEARIVGNARVTSGEGLELRARELELIEDGKTMVTAGRVTFGLEDEYRGEARRLHYDLEEEVLQLIGKVQIESLARGPEIGTVESRLLIYERASRILRLEGDVVLQGGGGALRARRLTVHLDEEEKEPTFVRAFWNVSGSLRRPAGGDLGTRIEFEGHELALELSGGEPERAELDPAGSRSVRLTASDDSGLVRRIVAPHLAADFSAGVIQIVRAYDGVELEERLAVGRGVPLRAACGQWLLAGFDPAGELEDLVLQNDADYQEAGLQLTGDRIERRPERSVVSGRPAVVRTDRGEVRSPRIVYASDSGRLEAEDGVRAELPREGRFRLIGEEAEEPIRVTAETAGFSEEPWRAEFRDSVRAWQGESYLVANRLVGLDDGDRLEAEGAVKTVVHPRPRQAPPESEAGERRSPVEVTAERMVYRRSERLITYSGRPRALQAGRRVDCDELEVLLGEGDRFESLLCRGNARLDDPARGQTVEGEEAHYRPEAEVAEVSGSPVVLRDRDGTEVRGRLLIYNFDTGTAQVRSAVAAAAAEAGAPPPDEPPVETPPAGEAPPR